VTYLMYDRQVIDTKSPTRVEWKDDYAQLQLLRAALLEKPVV
jgi:hypothetical protein